MQVQQSAFYKAKSGQMQADKAPEARLEFGLEWLEVVQGATITNATWTASEGVLAEDPHVDGPITYVWLSGGDLGKTYEVVCVVTMSDGRVDACTFLLNICRREPSAWRG